MATNKPQDDYQKQGVRIPRALHERLHEAAKESGRSYNSELIARIEASFEPATGASDLAGVLNRMESLVKQRERELRDAVTFLAPVIVEAMKGHKDDEPMPGDPARKPVGFWRATFERVRAKDQDDPLIADISHAITWSRLMLVAQGIDEEAAARSLALAKSPPKEKP